MLVSGAFISELTMLAGIRANLTSASLPRCFWSYAGECVSFNNNLRSRLRSDGESFVPYEDATGDSFAGKQFVTSQLVFYKPAPTVLKLPKVGDRLRPGIFMKYYMYGGRWEKQYVVAGIDSFANKNIAKT